MHLLEWMYVFLWSKENMGGGMGCPLWGSTRRKDASSFFQ